MPKLRELIKQFSNVNKKEILILLSNIIKKSYTEVFFSENIELSKYQYEKLCNNIKRRLKYEPIAKIIGYKEFYGLKFKTNKYTLDPRPETELLIDLVQKYYSKEEKFTVLDLGCGTGCIGLTIAYLFKQSIVTLCDISHEALKIAKINAKNLSLDCKFIQSNWFSNITGKYDLIISNPPYVAIDYPLDKDTLYDPPEALYSKADTYYKIITSVWKYLNINGKLIIEIGFDQQDKIICINKEFNTNLQIIEIVKDLAGLDRCVVFNK